MEENVLEGEGRGEGVTDVGGAEHFPCFNLVEINGQKVSLWEIRDA